MAKAMTAEDNFYSYDEFVEAVKRLGIKTLKEYKGCTPSDPKLPASPDRTYSDQWKGWTKVFKKNED